MFTIVVITDEYNVETYGRFATREAAERRAEQMAKDVDGVDDVRDGWVKLSVCMLQPLRDWA